MQNTRVKRLLHYFWIPFAGAFLLFIYGFTPYLLNSLSGNYLIVASTQATLNNGLFSSSYVSNFGYPLGYPFLQGLPFIYIAAIISKLTFLPVASAVKITGALFLLAGFYSLLRLLKAFGCSEFVSALFSTVYFSLNIIYFQAGYAYMLYGFMLMPAYVLMDIIFFKMLVKSYSPRKTALLLAALLAVKSFAIFLDAYSFVFTAVLGISLLAAFLFNRFLGSSRKCHACDGIVIYPANLLSRETIIGMTAYAGSLIFAGMLYNLYLPNGSDFPAMPADFYRGQSVDIVTMLLPWKDKFFAYHLGLSRDWNSYAFFGDGSNARFNFIPYSLLALFIYFILKKLKHVDFTAKGLLLGGCLCLVLSLGPSIKFNDHRNTSTDIRSDVNTYMMTSNEATLNLGTDAFYEKMPIIKNVRAVHRWLAGFMLLLIVAAAISFDEIFKRSKPIAICILFLCIIELMPNLPYLTMKYYSNQRAFASFTQDAIPSAHASIKEGERIFFLSPENDFLANYITACTNSKSYGCGGDKNMLLAVEKWPKCIRDLNNLSNTNNAAYYAFDNNILDKLILPKFNLRWNSYRWPPGSEDIVDTARTNATIFDLNDPKFFWQENEYFIAVQMMPKEIDENYFNDLITTIPNEEDVKYVTSLFIYEPTKCAFEFKPSTTASERTRTMEILIKNGFSYSYRTAYPDVHFNFIASFDKAVKEGVIATNDNPWGSNLAPIYLDDSYDKEAAIFENPGTSFYYDSIRIGMEGKYYIFAAAGFHPLSANWNVSDGMRLRIEAFAPGETPVNTYTEAYVMPKDELVRMILDLDAFKGKEFTVRFSILNDEGCHIDGDWGLWTKTFIFKKN